VSSKQTWKDGLRHWSRTLVEDVSSSLPSWIEDVLDRSWGEEEKEEILELANRDQVQGPREAVVFLPGVMGSLLASIRGINSSLWISPSVFLRGRANLLELNHDGTGDRYPQVEVVPVGIEQTNYVKLLLTLSKETDLYRFPYDWRRRIEHNADVLHGCIERWASEMPGRQFTLIGHSMGGLVAWAYMARHRRAAERRVRRLVMQGTPHLGVAGSVEVMAVGNRITRFLASLNEGNDIRRLILSFPCLYQLLPPPRELFPSGHPYPVNWDVYDARAWPSGDIRQDYLDRGRKFHTLLARARPQVEIADIVGCHQSTLVQVRLVEGDPPTHEAVYESEGDKGGDGTVPLWSVGRPDITKYYVNASHSQLVTNGKVLRALLEMIHGGLPALPRDVPPNGGESGIAKEWGSLENLAHVMRDRLEQGKATIQDLEWFRFM